MATKHTTARPAPRRARRSCARRLAGWAGILLVAGAAFRYRGGLITALEACPRSVAAPQITTLREQGGRVDWSAALDRIAYDRPGDGGAYEIATMRPDGADDRCVTCGAAQLPTGGHRGNPAWHPSGRYIVFQAQKRAAAYQSTPGFGADSDLWLGAADGTRFYQLTHTPDTPDSGVLHPHFSADGTRLVWSEMVARPDLRVRAGEFGRWRMMVADFALGDAGPVLRNVRALEPLGPAFYETHDITTDGRLLFSSNARKARTLALENHLYLLDLAGGAPRQLTFTGYSEHAHLAPDGRHIAWMWNRDNPDGGTDLWLMRPDGGGAARLTYYNHARCAEHEWRTLTVSDSSWGPGGDRIAAFVVTDLARQVGRVDLIVFVRP